MTAIQLLIKEIKNLTPVPAVIHPLLEAVDRPGVDIKEIAGIIQYDPALTASVLRTSNAAFFGLKQPAETIKDAVSLLGTDQVIDLVLIKSGVRALSGRQQGYDPSGRGHVEILCFFGHHCQADRRGDRHPP